MFIASGIGPYTGQAFHFKHAAPEPKEYALNRYLYEAERHWGILDARLAKKQYVVADTYTIADMAVWGWVRAIPFVFGDAVWTKFPNLKRHLDEINARPAAQRAEALKERNTYKTEMDAEAKKILFPHTAVKVA